MELIFRICLIDARLHVSLASRCLVADAQLWWMTLGERAMPSRTWAYFRTIVIARFGPLPEEGADMPYCDLEIYRDMYHARYLSYAVVWPIGVHGPLLSKISGGDVASCSAGLGQPRAAGATDASGWITSPNTTICSNTYSWNDNRKHDR